MYFINFPVIPYDSVGNGNFKVVTNLLMRVAVRSKVKTNTALYDTYDIKEGELLKREIQIGKVKVTAVIREE